MARVPVNTAPVQMVSLRDVRIANTSGHCINMVAGEPKTVPGPLVDDALNLGCVPADSRVYEDHKAKLERKMKEEAELAENLIAGIDILVRRNNFDDFTPTGHPKIDVLAETIDVDPNLITTQMRDHAFAEWSSRNRRATAPKKNSPASKAVDSKPTGDTPPTE